jgi:D-serine deaminase-like pyridoxal phosphate-dependent protein
MPILQRERRIDWRELAHGTRIRATATGETRGCESLGMADAPDADPPPLGCQRDDLDTPALCIDLDLMDANIRRVADACASAGVSWRPHVKGHRCGAIGVREVAAGAVGLTCAKLGEAELMARAGVRDLLIANAVVGQHKLARLVELSHRADPIVAVDHRDQLRPLASAFAASGRSVRVVIEVDVGMARAGVAPGEAVLTLAIEAAALEGIDLVGLMGWEGHLLTITDRAKKEACIHEALGQLVDTKRLLEAAGIPCPIVSCSGTGSFQISLGHAGVTEIQAGGAILMDVFYRDDCGVIGLDDALTLLTTVVGRPTHDRAIVDAGRKALNVEIAMPRVRNRSGLAFDRMSAEHGQLRVEPDAAPLAIGDRLEVVPGYADLTVFLHDSFYGFRAGRLVEVLEIAGSDASR